MKFIVTGHTGFKGAWLSLMLTELGHSVAGVSLPPRRSSLFNHLNLERRLTENVYADLSDFNSRIAELGNADFLIHLAAQPIVLDSWTEPRGTFMTNVVGTARALEMARISNVREVLVITTDKVYRNTGTGAPFHEEASLGGEDPYSSSKAIADIFTQEFGRFGASGSKIIIARGGNVIGGGDDSAERLVPDIEAAIETGSPLEIRNPGHVRPWQHVIDCLAGYLTLLSNSAVEATSAWNIGPDAGESDIDVSDFLRIYLKHRGISPRVDIVESPAREHGSLRLDVTKAREQLGFTNSMSQVEAIERTAYWYHQTKQLGKSALAATLGDLDRYSSNLPSWVK